MNKNTPPLTVYVANQFLFNNKAGYTEARLVGVRALSNQAIQFTVLLLNGALYTGLPVNAIGFKKDFPIMDLDECLMWDNISSEIDVITFDLLRYTPCTVKTNKQIIKGEYRFTIDYVGNNDLSRDPEHWKMTHVIEAENGCMLIYPQYRLRFNDPALCYEDSFEDFRYNTKIYKVGR
jgi:hypothetical protein